MNPFVGIQCWCGSGRPMRDCHGRPEPDENAPWRAAETLRRLQEKGTCFHAQAGTSTCSKTLTKAHTVRRAADLTPIARRGHVYAFAPSLSGLIETNGKPKARLVGINRASTFTGFCSKHDNDTFSPLEKAPISGSRQQILLLFYRSLARELHFKRANAASTEHIRQMPLGIDYAVEVRFREHLDAYLRGLQIGLQRLDEIKRKLDEQLVSANYDDVRAVLFWLDRPSDVVASGVSNIEIDFSDIHLHDLADLSKPAPMLSISILNEGSRSVVVLAWPSDSDAPARRLVSSLCALPDSEIPSAILRLLFDSIDNLFMRPEWWESLIRRDREALELQMAQGTPLGLIEGAPLGMYSERSLKDDGRRLVNWRLRSTTFVE